MSTDTGEGGCRCIVVDDDEAVRETLAGTLAQAGYSVRVAEDGLQALKLHAAEAADIVITDIVMPEMEGIEMILELRRRDPAVRILAISGGCLRQDGDLLRYAEVLGADAVLAKPFRRAELLAVLADLTAG